MVLIGGRSIREWRGAIIKVRKLPRPVSLRYSIRRRSRLVQGLTCPRCTPVLECNKSRSPIRIPSRETLKPNFVEGSGLLTMAKCEIDYDYSTGGNLNLIHRNRIGTGGFGEVHEVRESHNLTNNSYMILLGTRSVAHSQIFPSTPEY